MAISGTVPDREAVAASLRLQYSAHRPWVHTVDAKVILHLLRHADRERTTGVPAGAARMVNQMPLRWLRHNLCARRRHAGHPFWYVRATSHHSDALLHKADWAASQDTVLQNTPPDPGQAQLIVAGHDGHLDIRPPTMRTLGEVAQQAQTDHALTHRGHTSFGAAHATAYVHARDLTATATNRRALRARDGHTPVQRRLRVRKERLSGVAIVPQPCLLCGGPEETPVHMHVGCAHSQLLWPHYRQAVHEVDRHLPPRDKALWVASWRSAGATWTEVFCSGLVPEDAEAQLRAIARYNLPGGTSVDNVLHHMLRPGDFAWELRNHRLEQLLCEPLSAAARVHRWLTAAEGHHQRPPPRPDKDFVAILRVVAGTLECPPQEGPHPYRDLLEGFSKHVQDASFPLWIIRRGSMTAWEASIVGEDLVREWGRLCAATRAPETPVQRYAAIPLEGWGPDTRPRPGVMRGAGPDHLWDAATEEWLQAAPGPQTGWTWDVSSLVRTPVPPRIVLHAANVLRATEIRKWGHDTATVRWHPPEDGAAQFAVAHFKTGGPVYDDALSRMSDTQGPLLLMLPTDLAAGLRQELDGCEGLRWGGRQSRTATYWPSFTGTPQTGANGIRRHPTSPGATCTWQPPPKGSPARRGRTSSPPSTTAGFSPTTRGGRSSGRRSAGTTGTASAAACWRSGTPSDTPGTTSGSAISTLGCRPPTSHTPADSAGNATRCPLQRRQAPTGARGAPRWPRAPGPNFPRARAGARRRRPCTGASRGHTPPHTKARAPRALPLCGSTCTCGIPHPLCICRTCPRPDPHPPPSFAEPAVPCLANRGDWPGHARARRQAQESTVRGLVADAVAEVHEAHTAERRDQTGSARAFLNETALPTVRALNRAGAPTLLPAMHRIVNAIRPGLISPDAAVYRQWMEWRESNRSCWPLSMGDTLRLTGAGSAMSLRSSAPALLQALRTHYPGDTAPYLNQARATYPGGVSELDAALHLLHPPDEDLEVGEITVFVEGAGEAPARPRPTNRVYDGTRPTPPCAIVCEAFPRGPA